MYLREDSQGHLHLKADDYTTIKKAKNDSEKVELYAEVLTYLLDRLHEIEILIGGK